MNNKWSEDEDKILLEYCNKKIKLEEISIALNKRIGDIKYHIGDLAYEDLKNGISESEILNKYNLEKRHLSGAISRIKKKELKQISKKEIEKNTNKRDTNKRNTNKRDSNNDYIIISLLNEIKNLLQTALQK